MKKVLLIAVLTLVVTGLSFAQTDIGLYGIGGKIGITDPGSGVGSALTFGASADIGSIMDGQIGLQADVAYWSKSYGMGDHWKISQFGIAVIGKYFFAEASEQLRPFAGGGLGININSVSWEYDDWLGGGTTKGSDSSTDIGLHVVGGADYKLSDSMKGFAEFRYMLGGDWNFWAIFGGVIFSLGK